ncbi:MAG: Lrp/AsnC family transcriptional regulator [Bacteroidetes bacterium]|nr:MAG: Lrp/AsnC family transcriptional regulator [Bacteroidota bacterium]
MIETSKTENSTAGGVLDAKDIAILKLLQANARATVKEISERVHLSSTPVHERIKRMEEQGVIKQYVTLLDAEKVKKGLTVICYLSLKQHSKEAGSQFIAQILTMPEVLECYNISGEFDFMLKIVAENMNAYYDFHVNKLGQIENIGQVQSIFVMGIIKQTQQLLY